MATIIEEKYLVCSECKAKVPMKKETPFSSYALWSYPWKWFFVREREDEGFCSWVCTRAWGDRTFKDERLYRQG